MTDELERLFADTEAELDAAQEAADSGMLLDLAGLVPRTERLCQLVVAGKAVASAPRLAALIARLDRLEAILKARLVEPTPDPEQVAARYRAAAPPGREPRD